MFLMAYRLDVLVTVLVVDALLVRVPNAVVIIIVVMMQLLLPLRANGPSSSFVGVTYYHFLLLLTETPGEVPSKESSVGDACRRLGQGVVHLLPRNDFVC